MKKTMAFLIGLIAVLVIGGSVYAGNQIARSNAIGETAAQNFALVDAGVSPDEANFIRTEFEREDGRFVYDIKFYANGITYEYTIDSQNGWILAKEQEGTKKESKAASLTPSPVATPKPTATPKPVKPAGISLERAKELALADAGVTADQVTFSKAKLEVDDGVQIYDLEFYIDGQTEYDYEIAATDGTVVGRSVEAWEADDDYVQPAQQAQQTQQVTATPAPQKQKTQQAQQTATPAPKKQQKQQQVATPAPKKQTQQTQQAAPKKVYYDDDDDDWDDDPDYDDDNDDRDDDDWDDDDDD